MSSYRHIALVVPELRASEDYYQTLFDMQLIGREAELADGQWYTLPFNKGWEDAEAAGIRLDMTALQKDGFVLALFRGNAVPGQVTFIGLNMPAQEIAGVRSRLAQQPGANDFSPDFLEFIDPYGITWQISLPGSEFRTSGVFANRWLELQQTL